MQATYVFPIESEIRVGNGNWPNISFERGGNIITVEKPIPRRTFDWEWDSTVKYSKRTPTPDVSAFEPGGNELDLTLVKVGVAPLDRVAERTLHDATRDIALTSVQEFCSWVRVLTRQYWVGRYSGPARLSRYVMYAGQPTDGRRRHSAATGWGFEYGAMLDAATWEQIGQKLSGAQRPRASQLFFCDALLDIAEGDVAQATAGLGVSVEVEVHSLTQDIVRTKSVEFQRLFSEFVRLGFDKNLSALEKMGCRPFKDFDKDAHGHVLRLYRARNKAVHEGKPYHRKDGKDYTIKRTDTPMYVRAVERLFAWTESERGRVEGGG